MADVRVAYDQIDFSGAELADEACVGKVQVPLEKAMNEYSAAYRSWNRCIEEFGCEVDESRLQARWTMASAHVLIGKEALDELAKVDDDLRDQAEQQLDGQSGGSDAPADGSDEGAAVGPVGVQALGSARFVPLPRV